MAELGFRTIDEMIGRADCLDVDRAVTHWKAKGLDLAPLLHQPALPASVRAPQGARAGSRPRRRARQRPDSRRHARRSSAATPVEFVGVHPQRGPHGRDDARLRGDEAARRRAACPTTRSGSRSPARPARASARSCPRGMTMTLVGDANDGFGKGLSGGRLIVYPPRLSTFKSRGQHHHRQRRVLRRDQRRGLRPRRGRRALLRPQQRRDRGRRGRRRSRLRVHDRRPRAWCSAGPGATSPPA